MAEWNPWQTLATLRRELDHIFETQRTTAEPSFRAAFLPGRGARQYPLINVHEDKEAVYVEALAPGLDPQTLHISQVRNVLTIQGEKSRVPSDVKPEAFHRSERAAGKFVRNIQLPTEMVDEQHISAEYKQGLLTVVLPKAEKAKPKQINVRVA